MKEPLAALASTQDVGELDSLLADVWLPKAIWRGPSNTPGPPPSSNLRMLKLPRKSCTCRPNKRIAPEKKVGAAARYSLSGIVGSLPRVHYGRANSVISRF
jgi:hypothetical protein